MTKKVSFFGGVAVMSVFFLVFGAGTITPALNNIFGAFPNLPITTLLLVSTLPSLACVPATLLAGYLAGSRVKYRTLAIISILLFVIAGVAPAFTHSDFTVILIERAVFGFGLGLLTPLGFALVLGLYDGQERAKKLGLGTLIMNIGGIVLQFLGGALSGTKWYFAFLPHLLAIISLILVAFVLPEPVKQATRKDTKKPRVKIPASIIFGSIAMALIVMLVYPMLVNMSTLLVTRGLGNATITGTVLAGYTIGGMLAGVIFSNLYKITKRFIIGIGLLLIAAGLACVFYGNNLIFVAIGTGLVGLGQFTVMPALYMIYGIIAEPAAFAIASSIMSFCISIFAFLSTYWIGMIAGITGDPVSPPIFVGAIILLIAGIILLIVNPFPKEKAKSAE